MQDTQSNQINRQIKLKQRPQGEPQDSDFEFTESPIPEAQEGQLLVRNVYLSLDPFIRGRMNDVKSYAPPMQLGDVMVSICVARVVTSNNPKYQAGDWICSRHIGWQDYAVLTPEQVLLKINDLEQPSYALGILGMPGFTGYMGLLDIGQPKAGETLVVAAATGPVGSTVGQVAKIKGCRVVGVAGGPEKCAHAVNALGFDACIDHRADDFAEQLSKACPDGIDIYYENVGGKVFDAVMPLLNMSARIPVCGRIANYNQDPSQLPEGPDRLPVLTSMILTKRLRMQGFIIFDDYAAYFPDFLKQMGTWLNEGKIHYKEDLIQGLTQAPEAFRGLLKGQNFGKLVIQVGNEE